jgi:hypothetical protein
LLIGISCQIVSDGDPIADLLFHQILPLGDDLFLVLRPCGS